MHFVHKKLHLNALYVKNLLYAQEYAHKLDALYVQNMHFY